MWNDLDRPAIGATFVRQDVFFTGPFFVDNSPPISTTILLGIGGKLANFHFGWIELF